MDKINTIPFPAKPLPGIQLDATNHAPRIVRIPSSPFLLTILITLHGLHTPFLSFLPYWFRVLFHNCLYTLNAALLNLAERIAHVGYDPCDETTKRMICEIWHMFVFILELFPPTLRPHNVIDLLDGYIDSHWPEDLPRSVRAYDENGAFIGYVAEYPPWLLNSDPRSPRGSMSSIHDDSLRPVEGTSGTSQRARCESNASTESEVSYIKRYLERKKRKEELKAAGYCEDVSDEYEGDEEEGDDNDEEEEESDEDDITEEEDDLYEEDENEEEKVKEPSSILGAYQYLPFRL